jgi:putative beta-barrel porin BBP2
VSLLVDRQQERFEFTQSRNADSFRIAPSVEFAPTALISGRASVGMRSFDIADQLVSDFTGLVASLDLAYTLRGTTRFGVRVERDTTYSFSAVSSYYILTNVGVTMTHRLTSAWELMTFAERQLLNYAESSRGVQASAFTPIEGVPSVDLVGESALYGGGVGYRFSRGSRMSFTVDYLNRPAGVRGRYRNVRAYSTISYGF